MKIRKMLPEDAQSVASIHTKAWQFAYEGIIEQSFLNSIDTNKRELNWKNGIIQNEPPIIRLVAEYDNEIYGFACGLENRTKNILPECDSELWAIYVDPDKMKSLVGTKLLSSFLNKMKELKKQSVCVWVLQDNTMARNFYEKSEGILTDCKQVIKIGKQELQEVSYKFDL